MTEVPPAPLWLGLAFMAGMLVALLWLAALQRSVSSLPGAIHPMRHVLGGLLLRLTLVLAAFLLIAWQAGGLPALAALAGFAAGRTLGLHRAGERQ